MELRTARETDLSGLVRIAREHGGSESSERNLREQYRAFPDLFVVVVADEAGGDRGDPTDRPEAGGREDVTVVGEAHGRPRRPEEDPTDANGDAVVLDRIAVRPDRRGEGLGRRLLSAFERRAADRAPVVGVAAAPNVVGFYRACGYEPWAVLLRVDGAQELGGDHEADGRLLGDRRLDDGSRLLYVEPAEFGPATRERLTKRFGASGANTLLRKRVRE